MNSNAMLIRLVGFLWFFIGAHSCFALTFEDYEYEVDGYEVEITDCSDDISGDIIIPSEINGMPVTSIGGSAFDSCWKLESVTIPSSIKNIGDHAFFDCGSLHSVTLSEGVTSIGHGAFSFSGLAHITIPSSVTNIGDNCFEYTFLLSINVDSDNPVYSSVDGVLFDKDQSNLIRFPAGYFGYDGYPGGQNYGYVIPSSVAHIGDFAFEDCENLTSITIPASVTSIGIGSFNFCRALSAVFFLADAPAIVDDSIYGVATSFVSYYRMDSVGFTSSAWDGYPLQAVASMTDTDKDGLPNFYDWDDDNDGNSDEVELAQGTNPLSKNYGPLNYRILDQESIEITLCSSTAIGSVVIPEIIEGKPVTSILGGSFRGCDSVVSIMIPGSVTRIGYYQDDYESYIYHGYYGYDNYYDDTIGDTFEGCASLTDINVAEDNSLYRSVDGVLFRYYGLVAYPRGRVGPYSVPDGTMGIGAHAFAHCDGLSEVVIADSVNHLGAYAFANCGSITVDIGDGITYLAEYTFAGSSPDIKWGNNLTHIGYNAFSGCSLYTVSLPNSVTHIDSNAFSDCSVYEIVLGSNISDIAISAFDDSDIEDIYVVGTNPIFASDGDGVLFYRAENIEGESDGGVNVYAELVRYPPGKYGVSYSIPQGVKGIREGAFKDCKLYDITIPSSVISVGDNAFGFRNYPITASFMGDAPAFFGQNVFGSVGDDFVINYLSKNSGFTSPTWQGYKSQGDYLGGYKVINGEEIEITSYPKSSTGHVDIPSEINRMPVTSIGDGAFEDCVNITSVTIPDTVTRIGSYAFYYCEILASITISSNVTHIDQGAFTDCTSLDNITLPISLDILGYEAFFGCTSLARITIPEGVSFIGGRAFVGCESLTAINVAESNAHFSSSRGVLFNKDQSILISYPPVISGSYTIPNGVVSIGDFAFSGCHRLTSITIPRSVESLMSSTFGGCSNLKEAYFLGDVPSDFGGSDVFIGVAEDFKIYYSATSNGFYSPYWLGIPTSLIDFSIDRDAGQATPPASIDVSFSMEARGRYSGFLKSRNGLKIRGYFEEMFVNKVGAFTGNLTLDNRLYMLKGRFDEFGHYAKELTSENGDPVTLDLQLVTTESGAFKIEGTARRGALLVNVTAVRKADDTSNFRGRYTLLVPNEEAEADAPQGHGYATMTVSSAGVATITGRLADRVIWTARRYITSDGEMPLYSTLLNSRRGMIGGMISFRDLDGVSDCDGRVTWFKPQKFNLQRDLIGSRYVRTGVVAGSNLTKPNINLLIGEGDGDTGGDLVCVHRSTNKDRVLYLFEEYEDITSNSLFAKFVADYPGTTTARFRMSKIDGSFAVYLITPDNGIVRIADGVAFQKQDMAAGTLFVKDLSRRSLIAVARGFSTD